MEPLFQEVVPRKSQIGGKSIIVISLCIGLVFAVFFSNQATLIGSETMLIATPAARMTPFARTGAAVSMHPGAAMAQTPGFLSVLNAGRGGVAAATVATEYPIQSTAKEAYYAWYDANKDAFEEEFPGKIQSKFAPFLRKRWKLMDLEEKEPFVKVAAEKKAAASGKVPAEAFMASLGYSDMDKQALKDYLKGYNMKRYIWSGSQATEKKTPLKWDHPFATKAISRKDPQHPPKPGTPKRRINKKMKKTKGAWGGKGF